MYSPRTTFALGSLPPSLSLSLSLSLSAPLPSPEALHCYISWLLCKSAWHGCLRSFQPQRFMGHPTAPTQTHTYTDTTSIPKTHKHTHQTHTHTQGTHRKPRHWALARLSCRHEWGPHAISYPHWRLHCGHSSNDHCLFLPCHRHCLCLFCFYAMVIGNTNICNKRNGLSQTITTAAVLHKRDKVDNDSRKRCSSLLWPL